MAKATYDFEAVAEIWQKWREDRDDPPFMDAMSMRRRDELLDLHRRRLEAQEHPMKHWRAKLRPRVTKAEMVRDLERCRAEEERALVAIADLFKEEGE